VFRVFRGELFLICGLPFQPAQQIGEEDFGVFFKFERVMRAGILAYFLIWSGKAPYISSGTGIVDDAVLFGKQQQDRQAHVRYDETQIQIEPHALDEKTRGGLADRQRIVADEFLPARP
jgi:hypothetical protein